MTIELTNVSRWYGNVVAVNDITMSIGPGVTGLLGPNGAGKSTLMHMMAGFLPPSRGELTVAGAHSWRNPEIYRSVGLVPERDSLGRRRALLFALPAVILIAVTLALKASHPPSRPWPSHVLGTFGFSVLLPLTALIIGCSVLGAEIDDGSVIHLLATPVRRSSVIVTKFAVATGLTIIFAAVPELIAALIAGGGSTDPIVKINPNGPDFVSPGTVVSTGHFAVGLFVGALAGAVMYNAIFVMVSAATTRAIAVGLLYVLIWEALLSNFVSGARLLSVSHYCLGIANGIASDSALNAGLTVPVSSAMGVVVTALALGLAVNLLSSFTLKGEPA